MLAPVDASEPREHCWACQKPASVCVCPRIVRVPNRTNVIVAQHPRERAHPIGTARFVERGLARSELRVAFGEGSPLALRPDVPPGTALLFPGPSARDLATLSPEERPENLLVLDATWPMAKSLYRHNPWMAELPHVKLAPDAPSRYRIRKEPSHDAVSTLEAVVLALRILEPELEGLESLLEAFDAMIDTQIRYREERPGPPRVRTRGLRPVVGIPRALGEAFETLWVVYAELSPKYLAKDGTNRSILQWAAVRPATGEWFEHLVLPSRMPPPSDLGFTGLDEATILREGIPREALIAELRRRIRPGDSIAAYGAGLCERLAEHLEPGVGTVALRDAYASQRGGPAGTLDVVAEREGLRPAPLPIRGRAALRLANAVALARLLHEEGRARADRRQQKPA